MNVSMYDARVFLRFLYIKHNRRAGYTATIQSPSRGALFGISLADDGTANLTQEVIDVFTQQHYEAFARAMEKTVMQYDQRGDAEGRRVTVELIDAMIAEFEADNPKFKKLKFIESALAKANAVRDGWKPQKE